VLPAPIADQRFEPIPGLSAQVAERSRCVQQE
jgi:hypothetical protein